MFCKQTPNIKHSVLILFLLLIIAGCAGSSRKDSTNARTFTASSKKLSAAKLPIDRYPTWEVFFTLKKKVPCISLQTSAEYLPYQFAETKKIAKTFFILERYIDTSRFEKKTAGVYTELGRNFSDRWGRQRRINVCSSKSNPLQRLNPSSPYRLRITTFLPGKFDFTLTVFSDTAVRFFLTEKEALEAVIFKTSK